MTTTTAQSITAGDVEPPADRAGRIEAHGIDHIGEDERHGRPRDLFAVWAAPSVSYLSLVVGGVLVLIGLNVWQALAVIVVGNLFWGLVGLLATSGSAAGAPSEVIMRAMFGTRANRVNIAVTGWAVSVAYLSLSWAAAALAAFDLLGEVGIRPGLVVKIVVIVTIAALTLAISVYGHATIVRLYGPFTVALTAVFVVLAGFVLAHTDWSYRAPDPLHGGALWATVAGALALVASGPLSYTNSADFSRYLPRTASTRAVAGWTALGAYLPSVLFSALGVLAGTTLDMSDPQSALETILPGWFRPAFLLAIVLGAVANNAMTAYSSGLALQAIGVRIRRSRSVALDGAVGVALTLYALLVSNFLDTVSSVLELTVALLGPSMAIYAADILWRRNRYDGASLSAGEPGGAYWYRGGVNRAGVAALLGGTALAVLCLDTTLFVGPVARAADGADLSLPAGIVSSVVIYLTLMGRRRDRSAAATGRPQPNVGSAGDDVAQRRDLARAANDQPGG